MKIYKLLLLSLIISCAPLVKRETVKTFSLPVKGSVKYEGRGFFIKTSCDSFVRAVNGGRVEYAGKSIKAYNWIVIVKDRRGFIHVYGNLEKPFIRAGERIKKGQVIAKVGKRRNECGIYYEVRNRKGDSVFRCIYKSFRIVCYPYIKKS